MSDKPSPPTAAVANPASAADSPAAAAASSQAVTGPPGDARQELHPLQFGRLDDLPAYAKTLLKVRVSVEVTLAEKEMPISEVVNLVPGSIIQFDKSCEEMLEVSVGGVRIAEGDAVKVGDKFGLRVTSICLPAERYRRLRP